MDIIVVTGVNCFYVETDYFEASLQSSIGALV